MSDEKAQWQVVKSENGPGLKLFKVRFDYMKNPRNDKTEKMIVLDTPDSVNVVAMTIEGQIIFVRQFRFGIKDYTLELPGGIIDPGEMPQVAGERELREESGFTAKFWHPLGKIGSNPVFMNGFIHHFVATDALKTSEMELDDAEDISLVFLSIEETRKWLSQGSFGHPHTVNALVLFFAWYDNM